MTVDDGNFERTKDCDSLITDSPHRARVRGETASELQWQAHDYDERSDNAHLVSTTDKVSVSYAKRAGSPAGIFYPPSLPFELHSPGNWYVGQRLQCQRQRTPDPVNALSRHGHHARNAHRS